MDLLSLPCKCLHTAPAYIQVQAAAEHFPVFQEIEEDKKRAEQEGMAVTSRRPKQDGLTITITKAHNVSAAFPLPQDSSQQSDTSGKTPQQSSLQTQVTAPQALPKDVTALQGCVLSHLSWCR